MNALSTIRFVSLVAVACAGLVTACGSDESSSPSGSGGSIAGEGGAAGQGGTGTGGQSQGGSAGQANGGSSGQANGGSAGQGNGGSAGAGGSTQKPSLVINELDYDQVSPPDDTAEFIEILNTGAAAVTLDGLALVMVNGKTGAEIYKEVDLTGTLAAGAYLLVHDSSLTPPGTCGLTLSLGADNVIQNGEKDAIVLIAKGGSEPIDAVGYEGTVAAMTYGTATVPTTEGTGTTAADSNTEAGSIVRFPNATDTQNNDADFKFTKTPSPCADNVVN